MPRARRAFMTLADRTDEPHFADMLGVASEEVVREQVICAGPLSSARRERMGVGLPVVFSSFASYEADAKTVGAGIANVRVDAAAPGASLRRRAVPRAGRMESTLAATYAKMEPLSAGALITLGIIWATAL